MNSKESYSGTILARIALLQSMAALLPNRDSVLKMVCHGLKDIAGVRNVDCFLDGNVPADTVDQKSPDEFCDFPLQRNNKIYATLRFYFNDSKEFEPYKPFISNFVNMLAVIFEEETQRNLNKTLIAELEQRVLERTRELQASKEKYQEIVEKTSDLITIVDRNGNFTFVNSTAEAVYGISPSECIGKVAFDFIHKEDQEKTIQWFNECVQQRVVQSTFENRIVNCVNGEVNHFLWTCNFHFDTVGNIVSVHSIAHNITARKLAEAEHHKYEMQLQQTQKLESLGLLAGGIAHDFNNLLGGIFGYIDLAIDESHGRSVRKYLDKAITSIDRARALTLQLLTFAKGGAPVQKVGQLFPFIQESAQFALSGSNVSCKCSIQSDLWSCNFDKNQIGQVIDNMVINAQQAMPLGGTIQITAQNVIFDKKEHPNLSEGKYIKLSLKDSGIGIPHDLIDKIFDPFFTTKPFGHGLGLATCYSIVNRHGGTIDVESVVGQGTTFHVFLPACEAEAQTISHTDNEHHHGSGTFIVLDDEECMRELMRDMLKSFGYEVLSLETVKDTIDTFNTLQKEGTRVSGFLLDLTIPGGAGGKEAAAEIRKMNTDVPVFVVSGYAEDPILKDPAQYGFSGSISKPFRKTDLARLLNYYAGRYGQVKL